MTVFSTQTLLDNVIYGTASGNYDGSSQDFYSDAVPAANYYNGQGSLQTITYRLQDVIARITIQATLNDQLSEAKWFDVSEHGDEATPDTGTFPDTVVGNFVWLRARVQGFDQGQIQAVTAAY